MQTLKTDQTERMPRLIRVFAGRAGHFVGFGKLRLMIFSCCHSNHVEYSFSWCQREGAIFYCGTPKSFFFTDLLHSFLSLYSADDQKCIPLHTGLIGLVYLRIIVRVKVE